MKIRNIKMENIKGQSASQPLTGRDIIIGRNGAGKTTRMQAIGLATLGYVPGKGKTLADTFELASADQMEVGIETDSFDFSREFVKKYRMDKNGNETVKISQNIAISPSAGESTNKQKEERIRSEVGDFPAMLDFGNFLSLTDTGKRDFMYNLSGSHMAWNRERVEAHLAGEVLRDELRDSNPEMYEVMTECYYQTMKQYKAGAEVQDGLLAMSEFAKDRLSYWKKEKNNADAAAQKLSEIKNRANETDRDLAETQEHLDELKTQQEAKIKALATAEAKAKELEKAKARLEAIIEEIAAMNESQEEAELEGIKAELENIKAQNEELTEQEKNTARAIETLTAAEEEHSARIQRGREEYQKALVDFNRVEATIKAESDLIERILGAEGCCAFSKEIPCRQDFSGFIAEKNDHIDSLYEVKDEAQEKLFETQKLAEELEAAIKENREQKKEMEKELEGIRNVLYRESPSKIEELKKKEEKIKNKAPELEKKQAEKAQIEAVLNEAEEIDLQGIKEEKEELGAKIKAVEEKIEQQQKIKNDIANIKANIIDSKTATYQQECWKQITQAIGQKGVQGEIVKETLDPIRSLVDKKLEELEINKHFYFATESETGKEIFEFGWRDEHTKRPFDALSQGEQLLLMIALMTTIIEKSDPPMKVLALDNINHLDAQNLGKVIRGLNIAGKEMDNIILAGVVEPRAEDAEGWSITEL